MGRLHGKGGKSRNVVFGKKTDSVLTFHQSFLKDALGRPCGPDQPLFTGPSGRIATRTICHRMACWTRHLQLPGGITFHSWRHGAATYWLDNGVPLQGVQQQLGHSNIATTSVYLHFTREAREKLISLS